MLVFLLKQLASVSQAILGRNEPAQLAWGVACGILLGIVPHGNLLALGLLILLLGLRINHGIASIAAVAATLLATRLDPYSHRVGHYVLTHEDFSRHLASAWQLPLVPWTDINNTIVVGSLVIGLIALVPVFLLTYPIFHWFSPQGTPLDEGGGGAMAAISPPIAIQAQSIDRGRQRPVFDQPPATTGGSSPLEPQAIDAAISGLTAIQPSSVIAKPQVIETRIDVIRMSEHRDAAAVADVAARDVSEQDEPMSEALNYLLRQLNDSRQRRAA